MKYSEIKDELLRIFNEAKVEIPDMIHSIGNNTFIIYRGFKMNLSKDNNYIEIFNVRSNDENYKFISDRLLKRFINNGFIKTCDEQQIVRDNRRLVLLSRRIRKAIVKNDISKWEELRKERREKVKRIIKLKRKYNGVYS